VRRDGIVKVLDFGLAKLTEQPGITSVDPEAPTRANIRTDPGAVMGTAIYMSPEQARGLPVDARTDIFSLGVLIYEMIAGRLPFEGSNTNEILASILSDKETSPLARYAGEIPPELERIVEKALRKDRERRYQTTKDLLLDLKSLKQRLEFAVEVERSRPPETSTVSRADTTASDKAKQTAPPTNTGQRWTEASRRNLIIGLAVLAVAVVVGLIYRFYSAKPTGAIDSIAVLPLANASNDPNAEYLSDGISEALINSLTELQQLKVIARTTAFRYKGKDVDPKAIGRELNVRAVLMGRVRQFGDSLNVQVDLVDATTGAQLWGHEYESKASDLLSVKQTIAREVIDKLRLQLSGDEQQKLARRDTKNAEAYQYYLRGRYFWNKRTAEGIKKAIEQFQQSIDRDPNYALGYVGLADCYLVLEEYTGAPANETLPKARAFVDRAFQIDSSLVEAHTSSAFIYQGMWRWAEAEAEYKRAIVLNPNYPTVHHWLSIYLRIKGRFDDALREIKRAQELDPLSPIIGNNVSEVYLLNKDLNSAIAEGMKLIELDPAFPLAHESLGLAHLKQEHYNEAITEFQKAVELSGRGSEYLSDLGYSYALAGRRAEALQILKELEEKHARHESVGQYLARVYAGLGEKDEAFAWLEKDFQQRSGQLPFITWWPNFETLRSDQRYGDLVRRMGLQP